MQNPEKFTPQRWEALEEQGWRLVKIPHHLYPSKGWMTVLGYIGQCVDQPSIPVVQYPDGKIRACYCLYMVPPAPPTATERIGKWLSAALDDPGVCEEMKRDIRDWMEEQS